MINMKRPQKLLTCVLLVAFMVLSALPSLAASSWYVVKKSTALNDAILYYGVAGGGTI